MTTLPHGLSRLDLLATRTHALSAPHSRVFGRVFPENPLVLGEIGHDNFIDCLDALSDTMRRDEIEDGPADAGMTFFGQFVDHDITRDASSVLGTRMDPATIPNVRTPGLDLDSVYGDGPSASPHLYGAGDARHFLMFGRTQSPLDLARTRAGKALIGDPRNDENIILSQIHGAFICLHNILMSMVKDTDDKGRELSEIGRAGVAKDDWDDYIPPDLHDFETVRRFIRLHYQWIVWNEFLPAFVSQESLTAKTSEIFSDAPVMPIEFSGAAYRFGHATAQPQYRLRAGQIPRGLFDIKGFGPRAHSARLDFDQFFTMGNAQTQKARPVGPGVAAPLYELPFITDPIKIKRDGLVIAIERARKLPLRNLLRDRYTYELPSGQMVAEALNIPALPTPPQLHDTGLTRTPLWYYVLQEAQERGRGRLSGVGGRIVASVFNNLLDKDLTTYRHVADFTPWEGFSGHPTVLAGLFAFVETWRDQITHAAQLQSD